MVPERQALYDELLPFYLALFCSPSPDSSSLCCIVGTRVETFLFPHSTLPSSIRTPFIEHIYIYIYIYNFIFSFPLYANHRGEVRIFSHALETT
eukprot:gene9782-6860_t